MADGVIKLGQKITPHPCNDEMEARNWAAVKQAFEYLDQIINIEIINNEIIYNIVNVNNLEVTNVEVFNNLIVENDVSINNNLYVTSGSTYLDIVNINTLTVIYVTATNITVYNLTANYYMDGSGTNLCPPICEGSGSGGGGGSGGGSGSGGGGGQGGECDSIPSNLFVTLNGGANCPGITGRVVEIIYNGETGTWDSGPESWCNGGSLTLTMLCDGDLPLGTPLSQRLQLAIAFTCGSNPMPMGGTVPCTFADNPPFTADFGPLDIGPDWEDCDECCDARELGITASVSE